MEDDNRELKVFWAVLAIVVIVFWYLIIYTIA